MPGPEQSPVETYVIAPPDECDPHAFSEDTGPGTCEVATGLLVWPRDCTDGGENTRIEEILRGMDSKTLTSTVLNHSLDRPKHLLRRARLTDRSSSV